MNKFEEYESSQITPQKTLLVKMNKIIEYLRDNPTINIFLYDGNFISEQTIYNVESLTLNNHNLHIGDFILFSNNYHAIVNALGYNTFTVSKAVEIPRGLQGERGPQGIQGEVGPQGERGPQGIQGEIGPKGERGLQGIQGVQGERGLKGEKGEDGANFEITGSVSQVSDLPALNLTSLGIAYFVGDENPKNVYACVLRNGTKVWENEGQLQGPQGPQGIQGIQGIQGETGPQGERGPQGIQGLQGEKGNTGERGPQGIQGEKGPQGIQGERGLTGAKGDIGPQGPRGLQGEKGEKGDTGPQGPQGIQGKTGPQGPAGGTLIYHKGKDTIKNIINNKLYQKKFFRAFLLSDEAWNDDMCFELMIGSNIRDGYICFYEIHDGNIHEQPDYQRVDYEYLDIN